MAKRKNKDPGRECQLHPQRSFDQMVADATLQRLGGYIDHQIQSAAQAILARSQQAMANVLMRTRALEEIAIEKLGVTKDEIADRVARIQDEAEGFVSVVEGGVVVGDRVRLEVKTRTADQAEFQGSSRLLVDNAGTGATLGKELEGALVGMVPGETKEVKFGKDDSLVASIYVNKISRQPKQETTAEDSVSAEAPQEVADASPNAG